MRVALIYPIPFNLWYEYKDYVERFTNSFREFTPEHDYVLYATCHWGEPTDRVRSFFYGIKTKFVDYSVHLDGCQIGAQQTVAEPLIDTFVVGFTVHNYFHRAGWLKRLVEAREKNGPGLYGCSASMEGKPHIRTAGFGMDSHLWRDYPHLVCSRDDCSKFENGEWCVTEWVTNQRLPALQVTWDGEQFMTDWRNADGIFRRGEQNAMLMWDRHTDIYRDADEAQKKTLEDLCGGVV